VTDEDGWSELTFRCSSSAWVEADIDGTQEMDDGSMVTWTMKCLEGGSAYIRAGILASIALMLTIAF
jgi:hypothetical protein